MQSVKLMSKTFNDPIHGRIEIPRACVRIIDTPQFQRLRGLKQLGLTSFVFSGATHTRFEHSIGACWLAGQWATHLKQRHPMLVTNEDVLNVQIAALVHDLGHGCFSHTFERFIQKARPDVVWKHEEMSVRIFERLLLENDIHMAKRDVDFITHAILGNQASFLNSIVNNTLNGIDAVRRTNPPPSR